jgi:hypothetical protein
MDSAGIVRSQSPRRVEVALDFRCCEPAGRASASFAGDDYGPERSPRAKNPREYWAGRARWLVDEASAR